MAIDKLAFPHFACYQNGNKAKMVVLIKEIRLIGLHSLHLLMMYSYSHFLRILSGQSNKGSKDLSTDCIACHLL